MRAASYLWFMVLLWIGVSTGCIFDSRSIPLSRILSVTPSNLPGRTSTKLRLKDPN